MINDSADTKKELLAVTSISQKNQQNPHVIQVFEFWFHRNKEEQVFRTFILMELCDGTLEDYLIRLRDNNKEIELSEILEIMIHIMNGLCLCHDSGVCHRDLKLSNSMQISLPSDG